MNRVSRRRIRVFFASVMLVTLAVMVMMPWNMESMVRVTSTRRMLWLVLEARSIDAGRCCSDWSIAILRNVLDSRCQQ